MLSFKKILVPTDLSASAEQALKYASALADKLQANLHVLHVSTTEGIDPFHTIMRRLQGTVDVSSENLEVYRKHVEQTVEESVGRALPVHWTHVEGAQIASEIIQFADIEDIDLVVMGTPGHRILEHVFTGSVTDEVLRRVETPVLTIPSHPNVSEIAEAQIRHILAPIDFSKHSSDALSVAKELAHQFGSRISLLFVAEEKMIPIFSDTGLPSISVLKIDQDTIDRAHDALKQLGETVPGPIVEMSVHVRNGRPVQEILTFVQKENVDLIVFTTHGLSGFDPLSLGSVAERVVSKATCPVLTLKTYGKKFQQAG